MRTFTRLIPEARSYQVSQAGWKDKCTDQWASWKLLICKYLASSLITVLQYFDFIVATLVCGIGTITRKYDANYTLWIMNDREINPDGWMKMQLSRWYYVMNRIGYERHVCKARSLICQASQDKQHPIDDTPQHRVTYHQSELLCKQRQISRNSAQRFDMHRT
jgi:hypothetical protein